MTHVSPSQFPQLFRQVLVPAVDCREAPGAARAPRSLWETLTILYYCHIAPMPPAQQLVPCRPAPAGTARACVSRSWAEHRARDVGQPAAQSYPKAAPNPKMGQVLGDGSSSAAQCPAGLGDGAPGFPAPATPILWFLAIVSVSLKVICRAPSFQMPLPVVHGGFLLCHLPG